MFRAFPLVNSMRGTTKCSSTRPPSVCWWRTHVMSHCSRSRPAKASASKASMASCCFASLGASSSAKDSTPWV